MKKTLDERIESIIKKTVKYYYTDWKNYDRPKYMKIKGTGETSFLIARKCGTYLLTEKELNENESCKAIYNYYIQQEPANIYKLDQKKQTMTLIHKGITA